MYRLLQSSCNLCDDWINENWIEALTQWASDPVGGDPALAMLIAVPVFGALFAWSRSLYLPAVVLALLSGTVLNALPGLLSNIAGIVLWFITGVMIALVFLRS